FGLGAVVDERGRYVTQGNSGVVRQQHVRARLADRMIRLQEQPGPKRVAVVELVRAVALHGVGDVLLVGVLRYPREQQIAQGVRGEGQARVAGDERSLNVERAGRMLPAQGPELRDFTLILVEALAGIGRLSVDGESEGGLEAVLVRNLELADGAAEYQGHAVLVIQDVLEVAEAVILRGVVVDGIGAAVRRFDAQIVAQKIARDEVAVLPGAAAIVEAGLDLFMAAAVDRDRTARHLDAALGRDVDDARRAQAVFGRQRPGDQTHRSDRPRIQRFFQPT